MTPSKRQYQRAYRILTGQAKTLYVDAELLGLLWRDGGPTTRAILSGRFDPLLLDACHTIATSGPTAGGGSGNYIDYGRRDGGDRRRTRHTIDERRIHAALAGTPVTELDLTPAERQRLVRVLDGRGVSAQIIADRLQVTLSTVYRLRKHHDDVG